MVGAYGTREYCVRPTLGRSRSAREPHFRSRRGRARGRVGGAHSSRPGAKLWASRSRGEWARRDLAHRQDARPSRGPRRGLVDGSVSRPRACSRSRHRPTPRGRHSGSTSMSSPSSSTRMATWTHSGRARLPRSCAPHWAGRAPRPSGSRPRRFGPRSRMRESRRTRAGIRRSAALGLAWGGAPGPEDASPFQTAPTLVRQSNRNGGARPPRHPTPLSGDPAFDESPRAHHSTDREAPTKPGEG